MSQLSENYYARKCYLKNEQVPTQSVIIKKMSPPLATVYFKSMTPKLKILAGLEPPMKGGGSDWFVPPKELLNGKSILKPMKKEFLSKLGFNGIGNIGEKLVEDYQKELHKEKEKILHNNDLDWKKTIQLACHLQWDESSKEMTDVNTANVRQAFYEFTTLYSSSVNKIENIIFDGSVKEIERVRQETFQKMKDHYETLLKQQATMLYDRHTKRLMREKDRLKSRFIQDVEKCQTNMARKIHDIAVEKHVVIEKIRKLLECQNLACQVYVALKEREECEKETQLSKHEHKKKVKVLTEKIAMKEFEIRLAKEKEQKRQEFNRVWEKKVCHVVKRFQIFVAYCLNTLPEHADFFLNMEKLMLLQINEALTNPSVESIFVTEESINTPVPRPHPFYVFCDQGYPQLDDKLCPKHRTSSASKFPVIVVNKRCIYAECDNFDVFTDKIKQYIHGCRGDDADFIDDHVYTNDIPIAYRSNELLQELKLESSLMQVIQNELPNVKNVPTRCCICKVPHCFCSPMHASEMNFRVIVEKNADTLESIPSSEHKIETRSVELQHEREPKWESYIDYVFPKPKCKCAKTAQKHLEEHLPAYMRNMSIFDTPQLPNYETCSLSTLKHLVKKAKGKKTPPPEPEVEPSSKNDMGTQYADNEYDLLCTCLSDDEIDRIFRELVKETKVFDADKTANQFQVIDGSISPSYLNKPEAPFATDRAYSLRHLLDDEPQLEEIFKKKDCN